jgi:hypothetical protein
LISEPSSASSAQHLSPKSASAAAAAATSSGAAVAPVRCLQPKSAVAARKLQLMTKVCAIECANCCVPFCRVLFVKLRSLCPVTNLFCNPVCCFAVQAHARFVRPQLAACTCSCC